MKIEEMYRSLAEKVIEKELVAMAKRETEEKYRRLGEAIMRDYYTHGEKEIVVTITDASILEYLHVSVDIHPRVSFTEREQEKRRHL